MILRDSIESCPITRGYYSTARCGNIFHLIVRYKIRSGMRLATTLLQDKKRTRFKRFRSAWTAIESREPQPAIGNNDWKYLRGCQGASSLERIVRFPQHLRQVYPLRKPFASDRLRLIVLPPSCCIYSTQCGSTLIYRRYYRLAETSSEKEQRGSGTSVQKRKKKKKGEQREMEKRERQSPQVHTGFERIALRKINGKIKRNISTND